MSSFEYFRPTSLAEAFSLQQSSPGACFVAGGTDLLLRVREGRQSPSALISLRGLRELDGIRVGETTSIGAMTRVADLLANADLVATFPVLRVAARTLGSAQIRNVATIGGNLINASPCADMAPPLLVHDARVLLQRGQETRELSLAELFLAPGETRLQPGELLKAILLDRPAPGRRSSFTKIRRVSMDISIASVAVALDMEGSRCARARVAAGSVGPRPLRLVATEGCLEGAELDADTVAGAAACASEEVTPITDVRSTVEYRRHIIGVLVARAIREIAHGGSACE